MMEDTGTKPAVDSHQPECNSYAAPSGYLDSALPREVSFDSSRQDTEEALRHSEKRYHTLTEVSPVGIFYADPLARCTYVNHRWCEITGLSDEEAYGVGWVRALHPDDRERVLEEWRQVAEGGRPFQCEYRFQRPDGFVAWVFGQGTAEVAADGTVTGYVGTITDITPLKEAEENLSRLAAVVESSDDAIISCACDGRITSWNGGAEAIYGYRPEEAIGRTISVLIPEARPNETAELLRRISAGDRVASHETVHARKDGSTIVVSLTLSPILGAAGKIVGASAIARDITASQQLQEELRQAQKMEAIGRLAGGIAHDFNNLLTAINGYSDLTLLRLPEGDPLRDNIAEIKKAGERAASLTRQLLAFSRKQILQPQTLDLNVVISDMDKMLRRLIGEDIELITTAAPTLGKIKADPGQIEQIIVNLAVNARDAMPQGGKLILETTNVAPGAVLPGGPAGPTARHWVQVKVADTGCGMDAVTLSRIFEPFFTTKEQGKGTGLGLSMVYGIVKQSGGHIHVQSSPGEGTHFWILFPSIDAPRDDLAADAARRGQPSGWETVLLIEDEDTVRKLASHVLRMHGYRVLEARHAGEALLLCEQHNGPIHLMLTDVVMPQMNGRQLAERLAPMRPGMKVVYMSGYTDDVIIQAGLGRRTAFLQKPFPPEALALKVRQVLDESRDLA